MSNNNNLTNLNCGKCLELALEGERLCKSYEFDEGIIQFNAALKMGTTDKKVLSAIYSQLGNAYFYKKDYTKALKYHELDMKLSQLMNDSIGESKACGNLGNTLKMLEKYDDAINYCSRHLTIARSLKDKVGESRALYNLGNVYHTKGKALAINSNLNPINFSCEIKDCLLKAINFYEQNLELMKETGDRDAQGRAYGNIGNTYYLLGNFLKAVEVHKQRLQIAKECNDKEAERRAHCNLGNAHIFLGEFEKSIDNYKNSLFVAQELGNPILEAQACFSLGNTYTLLNDHKLAIDYYLKHLKFAQLLEDKLGQSRACWSLGNAYNQLGNTEAALRFANYHLQLSKETDDIAGQEIANRSVTDLKKKLEENNRKNLIEISNRNNCNVKVKDGINFFQNINHKNSKLVEIVNENESFNQTNKIENLITVNKIDKVDAPNVNTKFNSYKTPEKLNRKRFQCRKSMENMEIMKLTPRESAKNTSLNKSFSKTIIDLEEDQFLDLLAKYQSKRMDDQRCSFDLVETNKENILVGLHETKNTENNISESSTCSKFLISQSSSKDTMDLNKNLAKNLEKSKSINSLNQELFDLIEGIQSRRMDEQRAPLPPLRRSQTTQVSTDLTNESRNEFNRKNTLEKFTENSSKSNSQTKLSNVLSDDFFDMLIKCQSSRLEDQRTTLPSFEEAANNNNSEETVNQNLLQSNNQQVSQLNKGQADEDFLNLLMRFQAGRLEEQRSSLPSETENLINLNSSESNCEYQSDVDREIN